MKLQNNFTSVEQRKRLLELGVPADSADMWWQKNETIRINGEWIHGADWEKYPYLLGLDRKNHRFFSYSETLCIYSKQWCNVIISTFQNWSIINDVCDV